jgi:hypothetical protein
MRNNCDCNKNVSSYVPNDSVCGDIAGGCKPEDGYGRDSFEGAFDRFPIGMCYVPWQCFRNLYENEFVAMANGTLFKELDLKWYGRGCK